MPLTRITLDAAAEALDVPVAVVYRLISRGVLEPLLEATTMTDLRGAELDTEFDWRTVLLDRLRVGRDEVEEYARTLDTASR